MEVEHPQQNSTIDPTQPIFSVTLGMGIRQLRGLIEELKKSFGKTLEQVAHPSTFNVHFFAKYHNFLSLKDLDRT